MNNKKIKIGCGVLLLIIIFGVLYFIYSLSVKELRDLGDLSNSCNEEYKINITHYSEFEPTQSLFFNIKKKGKIVEQFGGEFEITNNMDESLSSFELNCYDDILYVTWKNGNYPLIMFDTKSNKLYYLNGDNLDYKNELFKRIKRGNPKLEID